MLGKNIAHISLSSIISCFSSRPIPSRPFLISLLVFWTEDFLSSSKILLRIRKYSAFKWLASEMHSRERYGIRLSISSKSALTFLILSGSRTEELYKLLKITTCESLDNICCTLFWRMQISLVMQISTRAFKIFCSASGGMW